MFLRFFENFRDYSKLQKSVLFLIAAEFCLQLINSSFLSNLPLFMHREGYTDGQVADATKFRYLGVLVSAAFVGFYIRRRKLLPLFYLACICVPAFAFGILYTIQLHNIPLNHVMQLLWGASFTCIQIPVLPFILRNAPAEHHTSAISLSYATWSLATIVCSIVIASLSAINPIYFDEKTLLFGITLASILGIWCISKVKITETVPYTGKEARDNPKPDWFIIFKALLPTLIIAVGAGITIPFISLFFTNVHHMSTAWFNATNIIASLLVAIGALFVPQIKKRIGYKLAIPTTQGFAILALILMATTQFYSQLSISVFIAVGCYLLRQPLMNMAGPMTSDVVMNYVGKHNQEIVSALTAAIWSGSWFFDGLLFGIMRDRGIDYVNIFLITAALYTVGVIWYTVLVSDYERRLKAGTINNNP
ncbi:MAG TPA: MFS transporter [Bacteroidia bacterium]|jgi:MFS family permease|nr:MFS transporter [Bacteroidia bacterium]